MAKGGGSGKSPMMDISKALSGMPSMPPVGKAKGKGSKGKSGASGGGKSFGKAAPTNKKMC